MHRDGRSIAVDDCRLGTLWHESTEHSAVGSCQVVARAFAFVWSNSAWVIVPASRSCLADAI